MATTDLPREVVSRARLVDVASATGVHVSTVSRALSTDPVVFETVRPERREQIRKAAMELGYQPNAAGRNLRKGASQMIGLLVPRVTDTVLSMFYDGMLRAAEGLGYTVLVGNTQDQPERRRASVNRLIQQGADAVVYTDAHLDETVDMTGFPVPVMTAYRHHGTRRGVTVDDALGGAEAAQHLADLGHRHVGILSALTHASTTVGRVRGFTDHFASALGDVGRWTLAPSAIEVAEGRRAAERLLALADPPTALFAADDYIAIGAMSAVARSGRRVGHDIAVVGFNDLPLAQDLLVPLTSVHVPLAEVGARALESIVGVLRGKDPLTCQIPTTLRVRESSGPRRSNR